MTQPAISRHGRFDPWVIAVAAAVMFLAATGARDLWNPNEPIYGQAVVEMADRGDWLAPTVNGLVFGEKPILYFWLARLSSIVMGGADESSLRVPVGLAGVAIVLMTWSLVRGYAGVRRARLAAALCATLFMVFWGSRQIQMDILVAATTVAAVLPVCRVVDGNLSEWQGFMLAGLAAGIGFLSKGPVAIALPAIVVVGYLGSGGRIGLLFRPPAVAGAVVALVVAAPWYVALWLGGRTDVLEEVLVRQNFVRFVEAWDHHEPWWYYLKYFWIDMAPWAWFVPLAWRLPARTDPERRLDLLAWVWIVGVVLFFSLSESKRSAYILPVAPAVAILASAVFDRLVSGELGRVRRNLALALCVAVATVLFGAGFFLVREGVPRYPDLARPAWVVAALLMGGAAAVITALFSRRRARVAVPGILLGVVAAAYLAGAVVALPAANRFKSARPFCEELNARAGEDGTVASYRLWRWRAGYTYYARRPIPNLPDGEALRDFWSNSERPFLIVERGRLDEVRAMLEGAEPVYHRDIGSNAAYLFARD